MSNSSHSPHKVKLVTALKPGAVLPFQKSASSDAPSPTAPTKEQYIEHAHRNLMATSRTANGVVDTSASPEKAAKMAVGSGDEAANAAKTNFTTTMGRLHDQRAKQFHTPQDLLDHVDGVNRSINHGIVKDSEFLRTDDSTKYNYVPVAQMGKHREEFAKEFHHRLDHGDPKETAAWIHHALNHTGHYYADGVGKTAEAVSNFVLMRHGHELPTYRSRKEIFENAGDMKKWHPYYRSLFPGGESKGEAKGGAAPGGDTAGEMKKSARALLDGFLKSANNPSNPILVPQKPAIVAPAPGVSKPSVSDVYVGRHKGEDGSWIYSHNGEHFSSGDSAMDAMRKRFPKHSSTVANPADKVGGRDSQSVHSDGAGNYALARRVVHEKIMRHFLDGPKNHPAYQKSSPYEREEGAQRHAVFMGGGAGSGKGYAKNAAFGHHPAFVEIDTDEIKKHLANADGLKGVENHHPNYWHEESSDISKELQRRAHHEGHSYIFDGTGANAGSVIKKMGGATEHGYQLHARKVETPRDLAWYRNNDRARTVPPEAFHNTHDGVQTSWPKIVSHVTEKGGTHDVFGGNVGAEHIHDKAFPKTDN